MKVTQSGSPVLHYPFLHKLKINNCGKLLCNRKHMPLLPQKFLLCKIQSVTTGSGMAMKWCNRQDMRILFIFHTGILEIEIEKQTGQF
jgi:hypothetical protein